MFHKIMQLIKQHETIIIHRHQAPDGDAIGAQIGLKEAIKETFPRKHVYCVGEENDKLKFLGDMDTVPSSFYKDALVVVLDSSERKMIDDERWQLGHVIVKIDHHIFKDKFADIEYIDTEEVSCCSIVAAFITTMGLKLNIKGAEALYTGIVTDSGRFRFGNNLKSTFDVCEKLFKYNIDTQKIYSNLYIEDLDMVLLRANATLRVKFEDDTAYLINTYKDVLESKQPIYNISRGLIGIMGGIRGIDKWANFTEMENGQVIMELRSSKYNVNKIASIFNGGGHRLASGATLDSVDVIDTAIKLLKELKD